MGLLAERDRFLTMLASCPECGVLCLHDHERGRLFDMRDDWVAPYVIPVAGLRAYLSQGIGVAGGCWHRCPPTLSELTEEPMKHTAIYVRVSSKSQDEASQLPDLKRFAAGSEEPVVWYRDKFTGKTMDRPDWLKLERAIASGEVARVVVWRLDRFGRTAKGLSALFADLVERGVGMVSIREGIDLSTPAGRMMAHVIASIAQYETEVRSERQLAGIEAAKGRGVTFGRPKGSGKGRRLVVTPEQEEVVRRLKAGGSKVASIARATGLTRPTVYSVLAAGTNLAGRGSAS